MVKRRSFLCRLINKNNSFSLVNINGNLEYVSNSESSILSSFFFATIKIVEFQNDFLQTVSYDKIVFNSRYYRDGRIKSMDKKYFTF